MTGCAPRSAVGKCPLAGVSDVPGGTRPSDVLRSERLAPRVLHPESGETSSYVGRSLDMHGRGPTATVGAFLCEALSVTGFLQRERRLQGKNCGTRTAEPGTSCGTSEAPRIWVSSASRSGCDDGTLRGVWPCVCRREKAAALPRDKARVTTTREAHPIPLVLLRNPTRQHIHAQTRQRRGVAQGAQAPCSSGRSRTGGRGCSGQLFPLVSRAPRGISPAEFCFVIRNTLLHLPGERSAAQLEVMWLKRWPTPTTVIPDLAPSVRPCFGATRDSAPRSAAIEAQTGTEGHRHEA